MPNKTLNSLEWKIVCVYGLVCVSVFFLMSVRSTIKIIVLAVATVLVMLYN